MNVQSQQLNQDKKKNNFFRKELPRYFLLIVTVVIAIAFWIAQPKFLTMENISNIICASALTGTMAIAVVVALASGEMNFAVGAQATIAAVFFGKILDMKGMPLPVALVGAIVAAMIFGFVGIGLTLKFGVPSFIATIGLSTFTDGVISYMTNNKIFFSVNWSDSFTYLGQAFVGKFPVLIIVFAIIVIGSTIMVDRTKLGRHIFAVGTNKVACRQVGIDNKKIKLIAFMISSALAGLSGILSASRDFNIHPQLGNNMQMEAFAAAMLGATFLRPGHFNIQGTIVAIILMTLIQNGIFSTGSIYASRYFFQGIIFLVAVGIIALTRKEGLPGVKFG
jgi:ribose transport system permease protein